MDDFNVVDTSTGKKFRKRSSNLGFGNVPAKGQPQALSKTRLPSSLHHQLIKLAGSHCADAQCTDMTCGNGCVCRDAKKVETHCGDSLDNDGEARVDCSDADCEAKACGSGCSCSGGARTETVCNEGLDNDGDAQLDCHDSNCSGKTCRMGAGSSGTCTNGQCL